MMGVEASLVGREKGKEGEMGVETLISPTALRQLVPLYSKPPTTFTTTTSTITTRLPLLFQLETQLKLFDLELTSTTTIEGEEEGEGEEEEGEWLVRLRIRGEDTRFGTIKEVKSLKVRGGLGGVVVLMITESGKLTILKIEEESEDRELIVVREILLDHPGHHYRALGKSLTVDPLHRSFTVTSWLDQFRIFFLPSYPNLIELEELILEDWTFQLPHSIIWKVDYLTPLPSPNIHSHYGSTSPTVRPSLVLITLGEIDKSINLVIYEFFNTQLPPPPPPTTTTTTTNPLSPTTTTSTSSPTDDRDNIPHQISRLPLVTTTGDSLPLHLIPLTFLPESLLIVTETQIYFITSDHITSGDVTFPRLSLGSTSSSSSSSSSAPLITSWADPNSQSEIKDLPYLYLGNDQGYLYRLDIIPDLTISKPGHHPTTAQLKLTILGRVEQGSIGSSLVVLIHTPTKDLLGYSGDFSDGGIIWVDPYSPHGTELASPRSKSRSSHSRRSHPHPLPPSLVTLIPDCPIPNLAPILDFDVVPPMINSWGYKYPLYPPSLQSIVKVNRDFIPDPPPVDSHRDQFRLQPPPVIYTCSGRHPFAAIHQIRHGHQATTTSLTPGGIPYGDTLQSLFHLPLVEGGEYAGLSFPHATRLIDVTQLTDCTESVGIQADVPSLFLGSLVDHSGVTRVIQVTEGEVRVVMGGEGGIRWGPPEGMTILMATSSGSYLSLITRQLELILLRFDPPTTFTLLTRLPLPHPPSCLTLAVTPRGPPLILVGTYHPSLLVYSHSESDIWPRWECQSEIELANLPVPIPLDLPHSILVFDERLVMVGLRDGFVIRFRLGWVGSRWELTLTHLGQVGHLPVTLHTIGSNILSVSDKMRWYHPDTDGDGTEPNGGSLRPLRLDEIITDLTNPILVIPLRSTTPPHSPTRLWVTQLQPELHLHLVEVDPHPTHHPRRLPIKGTPRRLIYNREAAILIILASLPATDTDPVASIVMAVDPNSGTLLAESPLLHPASTILEWDPELARTHHPQNLRPIPGRYLYLITTSPPPPGQHPSPSPPPSSTKSGAIYSLHLEVTEGQFHLSDPTRIITMTESTSLTTLCQYRHLLVVGWGTLLTLYQFSYDNGLTGIELEPLASRPLPTPIHHLTTDHGPTLTVATPPHSLLHFQIDPTTSSYQLTFLTGSQLPRRATTCLPLTPTLILAADRQAGTLFTLPLPSTTPTPSSAILPLPEIWSHHLKAGVTQLRHWPGAIISGEEEGGRKWRAIASTLLGSLIRISSDTTRP